MKSVMAALGLASVLTASSAARAESNAPARPAPADLTQMLVDPAVWDSSRLKGQWAEESAQSSGKSKVMQSPKGGVFDQVPQQIHAYFETGRLDRIEVVYLEAGLFFGMRESVELRSHGEASDSAKERRELDKKIREAREKESKEIPQLRKAFDARFKELEESLPDALERFCGVKGKRISVGQGQLLRSRVTEYAGTNLCMRLLADDDQLVSVTILRRAEASRKLADAGLSPWTRRKELRENVRLMPNGDTVIEDIPMAQQGGRGYCAMATLAMIMGYYGLNISLDTLADKAGYKEGSTDMAIIRPIYRAAAAEAKARVQELTNLDFRRTQDLIKRGVPVLVWRGFSRERDEVHTQFAQEYRGNPAAELPEPKPKERKNWPSVWVTGGHASLITGFNKERGEVLFTESWGEGARNRRMRAEEMEATAYRLFVFEP